MHKWILPNDMLRAILVILEDLSGHTIRLRSCLARHIILLKQPLYSAVLKLPCNAMHNTLIIEHDQVALSLPICIHVFRPVYLALQVIADIPDPLKVINDGCLPSERIYYR